MPFKSQFSYLSSLPPMKYTGFYLNLDRSGARRERIEAMLSEAGLAGSYTRVSATDGNTMRFPNPTLKEGEIGCFSSHYRIFADNIGTAAPIHVIEDDIVLSKHMEATLDQAIDEKVLDEYDLIFTDVHIPVDLAHIKMFKKCYDMVVKQDKSGAIASRTFGTMNLIVVPEFASATSYLINPKALKKLTALCEAELKAGAKKPVDLFLRDLCHAGHIRCGCFMPFLTSIQNDGFAASTIGHDDLDQKELFGHYLVRKAFYADTNMEELLQEAKKLLPHPPSSDRQYELLIYLLASYLL